MKRCPVCGGAFECPANDYLAVRPPRKDVEVIELPKGKDPGDGWVPTHHTKRTTTWVRKVADDGYLLHIVGTAQAGRIRAHYEVQGTWVGMTKYAFMVVPNPDVWPEGALPIWEKY